MSRDWSLEGVKPTNNGSTDQLSIRFRQIKEILNAEASSKACSGNIACICCKRYIFNENVLILVDPLKRKHVAKYTVR